MFRLQSFGANPRRAGFTLVELLVVIGIIALLISILLPALNAARRQADRVKCLAGLQQIGQAYHLYAVDNQGWWPVGLHHWISPAGPARQKRWHDFIGKYLVGHDLNWQGTQASSVEPQIWDIKDRNNVLWGCPAWQRATKVGATLTVDPAVNFHPGYAMSWYPVGPVMTNFPTDLRRFRAYIWQGSSEGRYYRQVQWKGASENGLIVESVHGNLTIPLPNPGYPYQPEGPTAFPTEPDGGSNAFDFNRHGRLRTGNKQDDPSMNMLFADGHADTVSFRQAYRAVAKR
jgi:prepilin-type N-terminal cleavage/methylation domain-containing protein/prepilin-type processing-associated H-X9-DG protein